MTVASIRAHRATPENVQIVRSKQRTAGESAAREHAVKQLAHALATSPNFSTAATYDRFVTKRRAK